MASVATDAWCSLRIRVLGQHVGRSDSQSKQGETRTLMSGQTNQGGVGRGAACPSPRPRGALLNGRDKYPPLRANPCQQMGLQARGSKNLRRTLAQAGARGAAFLAHSSWSCPSDR